MLSRSSSLLLLAWLGLSLSLASAYHHRNFEQVRVVSHSKASAALLEEQTAIPNNDEASKKTHLVSHAKEDDARNTNGLVSEAVPMLPERNEAYDQAIFYDQGIHTLGHATGAPGAEEGEQHELNRREPLHDAMEAHDSMAHAVFDTQGTPGLDHSFEKEDMQLHANPPSTSAHHGHSAPAPAVPAAAPAAPAAPPAAATPSKKQSHQVQGQFPGADAPPSDATLNSDYAAGELSEMSEETEAAAAEEDAEHAANHSKLRLTTKKWTSCADKCKGEGEITDALKAGKKTPRCCVDLIYDTVTYVDRLLSRNKITYWTMKGTLLGVVREKGVIPHDYDIDIGVLFRDLNKIASLRQIIDQDGYVLLQAPWSGYNNMNFVIVKKTEAVKKYFKKNPVKDGKLPKFTKGLRERSVSAELMVFEEMNGMLIQVLCTHPHPENPHLYAGNMNRDQIWKEYLQDEKAYQARAASETDGWLKYANQKDLPWVNYHKKFKKNMAPNCERTAPSSFKYEAPAAMVLPPKRARYFSTTLAVPNDPHGYCTRYFGKDYMTPKRRYGL